MAAAKRQRTSISPVPSSEELCSWREGTESAGWIHMNAAGASPPHDDTHKAMIEHLQLEREIGGYAAAAESKHKGNRDARVALAELLNCASDEIALVESAQAGWAKAFYSMDFRAGDRILCFASEYAGNAVAFLQMARRTEAKVEVLPLRADGVIDTSALKVALDRCKEAGGRTLVALAHIQTDTSVVQPAAEVGVLAKNYGATYLLDACQSIGQMPIDVSVLQCDFACGTGRKWLRGPRGTGFLYCRRSSLPERNGTKGLVGEPPCIDHFGASWTSRNSYELPEGAQRYEMWESSVAARLGLAVAVDVCRNVGPARIAEISGQLATRLRARLSSIPGVCLRDHPAQTERTDVMLCGIVTFEATSLGVDASAIKEALAERKVAASVSPSYHTFDDALWTRPPVVRLSPTYFNTECEVDDVADFVIEILASLQKASPAS